MAAEEQENLPQEDTGTAEDTSAEELWEQDEDTSEEEPSEVESQEDEVVDEEEEPEHDYEQRYKSLEKEFHRRNEDTARMRDEFQEMRLTLLEQEQEMDRLRKGEKKPVKQSDPTSEDFFNEDDRQTMEEFSEITGVTKKLVEQEVARRMKELQPQSQKIEQLEKAQQEQNYQAFLSNHEQHMIGSVGDDYREIDRNKSFQSFVLKSPTMTKMMTESVDPIDHADVMNMWIENTPEGKRFRSSEESSDTGKQQARRRAATGLVKTSAPRMERNLDGMSAEEIWESIPNE